MPRVVPTKRGSSGDWVGNLHRAGSRRIQALRGVGLQGYRFKESQYLTSHPSLVLGRAEWVVPAAEVSQS